MRKIRIFIAAGAVVVTAAILLIFGVFQREEVVEAERLDRVDLSAFPTDEKAARRELQKATKALAKLQPTEPYIVINTHANLLSFRTRDSVLFSGTCSTGSGELLVDSATGRRWIFNTPIGVFKVNSKKEDPWWRKPDWAYIEENEAIPKDESERMDPEMLGKYAIGFGDGFFIHGTIYKRLLGVSVTHGCVRLGDEDLEYIYSKTKIGTNIFIF